MNQQRAAEVSSFAIKHPNRIQHMRRQASKQCPLCKHNFQALNRFALFCDDCKEHNDRYKFSEWLPSDHDSAF